LYRSVWRGRAASMKDPSAFYALVLSGAQGRATVQQWIESTVQTAQHNLARHFADTAIARNCAPPKGRAWPPAFSLSALLEAIAVQGKRDNVPGPLVGRLIEAVFNRQRYPLALLQRALLRARAEAGLDDWPADTRRDARAALIKGILRRNFSKEVHETMDRDEKDEGYLFGRLMALIECMQQTALGSVNATVVDRFFGSASATPAAVFPRLLKNFRHHAAKAKAEGRTRGRAIYIENALDEIAHDLDAFPSHLDLQQQGLFVLGYHHQRYELWHKRDKAAQEQESEATQTATD